MAEGQPYLQPGGEFAQVEGVERKTEDRVTMAEVMQPGEGLEGFSQEELELVLEPGQSRASGYGGQQAAGGYGGAQPVAAAPAEGAPVPSVAPSLGSLQKDNLYSKSVSNALLYRDSPTNHSPSKYSSSATPSNSQVAKQDPATCIQFVSTGLGRLLICYGRKGKSVQRRCKVILPKKKGKAAKFSWTAKSVKLEDIQSVTAGNQSHVFQRFALKPSSPKKSFRDTSVPAAGLCFTVNCSKITMGFKCSTAMERDRFVIALNCLIGRDLEEGKEAGARPKAGADSGGQASLITPSPSPSPVAASAPPAQLYSCAACSAQYMAVPGSGMVACPACKAVRHV